MVYEIVLKGYCVSQDFAVPLHRRKIIRKDYRQLKETETYENKDDETNVDANVLLLQQHAYDALCTKGR